MASKRREGLQEGYAAQVEEAVSRVEGLMDRAERLGLEPDEGSVEEIRKDLAQAWAWSRRGAPSGTSSRPANPQPLPSVPCAPSSQ